MPKICDTISIRKVNDLILVFYDAKTIYVKSKLGLVAYERWFMRQRMFYSNNFRPFSESLKQNRHITLEYINRLAEMYDITVSNVHQLGDFGNKKIKILPAHGRNRSVNDRANAAYWQSQKEKILKELGL
jgi:hypothetical protein|nr:MAG TPA: hypothetical protein [Caudoviricetes sp.]